MSRRILLASNDKSVGALVGKVLANAGYEVITVENGASALAALLAMDADFDMAILDGQLPPVSGNRVVAALRANGCLVPVMLASGSFVFDELPSRDPRVALLSKPFRPEELLHTVESLLKAV